MWILFKIDLRLNLGVKDMCINFIFVNLILLLCFFFIVVVMVGEFEIVFVFDEFY